MTVRAPLMESPVPLERPRGAALGAGRRVAAVWLVAAAIAALVLPITRASSLLSREAARSAGLADSLAATTTALADPSAELSGLQEELAVARATASVLDGIGDAVASRHVDWPAVLLSVGAHDPERLAVTSLTQEGRLLKVQGEAVEDAAVVEYVDRLEASGLFARVSVQSIESFAGTPVATAQATATSGATTPQAGAVPTVTAPPGDAFEAEDGVGSLIVPGAPQARTFHAAGDVDRARFTAKSGRTYRVRTEDLAASVDTALTVRLGWLVAANDDVAPGVLASEVVVSAPPGADQEAHVELTNRGVSGPGQSYRLVVEEVLASPTATPSVLAPTATDAPTPQPTPTFDLRDSLEPDDPPPPIAVGASQLRSFYPDGDMDRALLAGQPGRTYRVYTHGLAPDVNTFLAVRVDGAVHLNDDARPGDLSSEVLVSVGEGGLGQVLIEVTNRGRSGPAQWYRLAVEDVTAQLQPFSTPDGVAPKPTVAFPGARSMGPWDGQPTGRQWAARQASVERSGETPALLLGSRVRFVLLLELKTP
jgi:Tfp pilus assembly protein PilN